MRARTRHIVIASIVAITIVLVFVFSDVRQLRLRQEMDPEGLVLVQGDTASVYTEDYRAAADCLANGHLAEAESIYTDLMQKEPSSSDARVGLAICRMRRHDFTAAQELCREALKLEPESVNARMNLGGCYLAMSDYTNAIEQYEVALALDAECPDAHWGLCVAYAGLGDKANAVAHLARFKELAPDSRHITALEDMVNRTPW